MHIKDTSSKQQEESGYHYNPPTKSEWLDVVTNLQNMEKMTFFVKTMNGQILAIL